MNYFVLKLWKTLDGNFFTATISKPDYDLAVGEMHSIFKPMQNDSNVEKFKLFVMDENGSIVDKCGWTRPQVEEQPTE